MDDLTFKLMLSTVADGKVPSDQRDRAAAALLLELWNRLRESEARVSKLEIAAISKGLMPGSLP